MGEGLQSNPVFKVSCVHTICSELKTNLLFFFSSSCLLNVNLYKNQSGEIRSVDPRLIHVVMDNASPSEVLQQSRSCIYSVKNVKTTEQ